MKLGLKNINKFNDNLLVTELTELTLNFHTIVNKLK